MVTSATSASSFDGWQPRTSDASRISIKTPSTGSWPCCALVPAGTLHGSPSAPPKAISARSARSEEHTSELQSLMRISYAVFCLKKKTTMNLQLETHHMRSRNESEHK